MFFVLGQREFIIDRDNKRLKFSNRTDGYKGGLINEDNHELKFLIVFLIGERNLTEFLKFISYLDFDDSFR